MKITTVNYQKVFPLGQYINERIGVEIQVDPDESEVEALREAKRIVEQFHKDNNHHLYTETPVYNTVGEFKQAHPPVETPPPPKRTKEEMLLHEIEIATSIASLNQWKLLISNSKQEIKDAYEKKLLELSK